MLSTIQERALNYSGGDGVERAGDQSGGAAHVPATESGGQTRSGGGPASNEERLVWTGTPSQWVNFWPFVFAFTLLVAGVVAAARLEEPFILLTGAVALLIFALWPWLRVRTTMFQVTTERISVRSGIFTRRKRDMELYRVKDTTLHEPFFLRLLSLANIEIVSSDKTTPFLLLPALRNAESLRQQIRQHVERTRVEKRVRELDFE
jgi:membrane protein YdbS with pleckstrin-like domain